TRSGTDRGSLVSAPTSLLRRGAALVAAAGLIAALAIGPVRADSTSTKSKLDAALKSLHSLEAKISGATATINPMKKDMKGDADLIINIQKEQNRLRSKQAELESLETDLRDKQAQLQDQQAKLQTQLAAEQTVLNQLDKNEAAASKLVSDLRTKYKSQLYAEE